MFKKLSTPYPIDTSIRHNLGIIAVFSLFIFFFNALTDFAYEDQSFFGTLLPAIITFLILSFSFILMPRLFPKHFHEDRWTVGREIFWSLMQFVFIGAALFFYQVWLNAAPLTLKVFSQFITGSFAIGAAPAIGTVMYEQNRLLKRTLKEALALNQQLKAKQVAQSTKEKLLVLTSENEKERIQVDSDDLILISSSDNYVEIYYLLAGQLTKHLLRSSLKRIAEKLVPEAEFFQSHRAHIVNLNKLESVSGNAQGYKLQLAHIPTLIPVSRSQSKQLKLWLNTSN